jgi:ribosomal protein S18 acetylase RimI-like enzyme
VFSSFDTSVHNNQFVPEIVYTGGNEPWWLRISHIIYSGSVYTGIILAMQAVPYKLERAKRSESSEIAELEAESFPVDEAATPETIDFRLENAGKYFYAYKKGTESSELVGFINGTCVVDECLQHDCMTNHVPEGRVLVIHSVTIRATFRKQGLGSTMLREYVKKMKLEPSIDKIMLLSKAHMLQFYIDCGFHVSRLSSVLHGQVAFA